MSRSHIWGTRYWGLNDAPVSLGEAAVQCPQCAGTFTKLAVQVNANTANGQLQIWLRLNGANTALTVTIPAGAVGLFTSVANVAVAEDQLVNMRATESYTSGQVNFTWRVDFNPT